MHKPQKGGISKFSLEILKKGEKIFSELPKKGFFITNTFFFYIKILKKTVQFKKKKGF